MKRPLFLFAMLAAASLNLTLLTSALAQDPSPSPTPDPDPSPPPIVSGGASAAVSAEGAPDETQNMQSQKGCFSSVTVDGQIMNVALRFPPGLAGTTVIVQPLDGGSVSQQELVVAQDGTASLQFQPPADPGTYRLTINAGGQITMLQFEVPQQ